ncbi:hypothetical protein BDR05DRAFT_960472, partial [Suillus weaverae]
PQREAHLRWSKVATDWVTCALFTKMGLYKTTNPGEPFIRVPPFGADPSDQLRPICGSQIRRLG